MAGTAGDRSGTRVAVADRHDIFRAGLRHILTGLPTVVLVGEATTADEARQLCRVKRPDVLLLDAGLVTGGEQSLVRELCRLSPRTAVVVLSDDASPPDVLQTIGDGAAGYLLKGVPADELRVAIDRATAGEAFVDPELAGRVVQAMSHRSMAQEGLAPAALTPREVEVLGEISRGRSNKEIAFDLHLAVGTVKVHVERILRKLSASNRAEATTRGLSYGLIQPNERDTNAERSTHAGH